MVRFNLETRGETSALICNHCKRPFLEVKNGVIELHAKHGSNTHENVLTVEHLRMLAIEMYRQTHPPERW
jgi:hypothetical protein